MFSSGVMLVLALGVAPELDAALSSLRAGERERLEAAIGPASQLPQYQVQLEVDPASRVVKGRVFVKLTALERMATLELRATPNAAHPGSVQVDRVTCGAASLRQSLVTIVLREPVSAGKSLSCGFSFTATVPRQKMGHALSMLGGDGAPGDYGAFSASANMLSLVGVLPMVVPSIGGRRIDGPSGIGDLSTFDPSHFTVSASVPRGWSVVSNGSMLGELPAESEKTKFTWAVGAARDLPLFVMKAPFISKRQLGAVSLEVVLAEKDEALADSLLDRTERYFGALESKLGPYPFQTLRVVEMHLESGAGGMEFPGLITISSGLLSGSNGPFASLGLDKEQLDLLTTAMGGMLERLMDSTLSFAIAHELAHQYSAMLVGSDPIEEPLADEPMTQHLALLAIEQTDGKEAAGFLRDNQLKATFQMYRMMGGPDGKANRPTSRFTSNFEYAALVYGKAPLLFDAERALVGDEAWGRALRSYVDRARYKWVTAASFHELLAKQNPEKAITIERLRKHWWDEVHGDEDLGSGGGLPSNGIDPKQMDAMMKQLEALMRGD